MFTHMTHVKTDRHQARGAKYEIYVYQVAETGEYRIFVAKGGLGVGDVFIASQEAVRDAKSTAGMDLVNDLIATAKDDIDRNEFNLY